MTPSKQSQAYALRLTGYRPDEIAGALQLTVEEVQEMLLQEGEKRAFTHAETLRISTSIELDRLDALLKACQPGAEAGDLASVDRVLRIMERRAKLLGLDQPEVRAQISVQMSDQTDLSKLSTDEIRQYLALQAKMSGEAGRVEKPVRDVTKGSLPTEPLKLPGAAEEAE
jgi:hypothetical protein